MVNPFESAVRPGEHRLFNSDDHSSPNSSRVQHEALALLHRASEGGKRSPKAEPAYLDIGRHGELFGARGDKPVSAGSNRDLLMESAERHFKHDPEKLLAFKQDMSAFESRMGKAG